MMCLWHLLYQQADKSKKKGQVMAFSIEKDRNKKTAYSDLAGMDTFSQLIVKNIGRWKENGGKDTANQN